MSVWIRNLKTNLENRPVLILHGNVRDRYIDSEGHIYENLTHLLRRLAEQLPLAFTEFILYDGVANERRVGLGDTSPATTPRYERAAGESVPDFAEGRVEHKQLPPGRFLAAWLNRLRSSEQNCFAVIHYLDKLVAYETSQSQEQRDLLLRLEKLCLHGANVFDQRRLNMQERNCWFCNRNESDESASVSLTFERKRQTDRWGAFNAMGSQWTETMHITVPRCRKCRLGHGVQRAFSVCGVLISLPFLPVAYALQGGGGGLVVFGTVTVVCGIGYGIGLLLGKLLTLGIKIKQRALEYPPVLQAKTSWGDPK